MAKARGVGVGILSWDLVWLCKEMDGHGGEKMAMWEEFTWT